jgi:hypothetical protein
MNSANLEITPNRLVRNPIFLLSAKGLRFFITEHGGWIFVLIRTRKIDVLHREPVTVFWRTVLSVLQSITVPQCEKSRYLSLLLGLICLFLRRSDENDLRFYYLTNI